MKKIPVAEQARLARRLSAFLNAGISIVDAVRLLKKPLFRPVIRDVSKGRRFSEALEAAGIFDRSLVGMIRIGERSGTLADALARAAHSLERRDELSRTVSGAMVYPAFIACATAGIAGFLVVYIFPKIIPLITGMGIRPPLLTRVVMIVSDVMIHRWLEIGGIGLAMIVVIRILWKFSARVRRFIRSFVFAVPIVGSILRGKLLVDIFRSTGLLVEHGELVPEALVSVSRGLSHERYASVLLKSAALVTDGEDFATALVSADPRRRLFPPLVADFIEMGERTGGMASACSHIAAIYEAEVEESVKRVTRIIEPVLMLVMGLVVGAIALSIVMPIYAITANLTK